MCFPPKASKIFDNNLKCIVEFKATDEKVGESFGTAEFLSDDGILITNAHVATYSSLGIIKTFENYFIRFSNEDIYRKVILIKYDLTIDIAVLKFNDTDYKYKPIKLGDSTIISHGDKVYAIGNAMNHGLSITQGIISIPSINIEYQQKTRNVIQCDITITEGSSGGALLDKFGRLIGITTFRTKDNHGTIIYGIAYAVPVNIILEFVDVS